MDIVLRGYLKCKAKGSWPKNWTKLWFILRHKSDGTKQLEYHDNEKKSTVENAIPKGIIDLSNVMLVQRLPEPDKKTQFMMTFSGVVQYRHFDAPSEYNMEEWVTSLNSIVFSKIVGDVMFNVDMHENEAVPFHGPCEMILKEEIITVRNRVTARNPHQQQFQWGIAHVKKFWAKSDVHQLMILVGRQSSTGPGEFVFTTPQSMQIMHGITAMLNEAKRKHGLNMPMTAPSSVEAHTTLDRPISTERSKSAKVKIAPYASKHQQKVSTLPAGHSRYNQTEFWTNSSAKDESYDLLSHHTDKEKKLSVVSQPYDMLDHADSNRNSVCSLHLSPRVSPRTSPSNSRKSSYNSLNAFGDTISEEVYVLTPDDGEYGKLEHNNRPPGLPPKKTSNARLSQGGLLESSTQQSEYGKLVHSRSSQPSVLHPKRSVQENEYGKLDYYNQHEVTLQPDSEYGRLDHANRMPEVPQTIHENEYGKLDRSNRYVETPESQSEYGKLNHMSRTNEPPRRTVVEENVYGKLDRSNHQYVETPESQSEYGKLNHTSRTNELPRRTVVEENVYGKLDRSNQHEASLEPQSEYGKLDHVGRPPELPPKRKSVQESEYGKLDHSKRYVTTPEPLGEHRKLNYSNTTPERNVLQENVYGKLARSSHHNAVEAPGDLEENEYSRLDHGGLIDERKGEHRQSNQRDTAILQQNNYQNQREDFSPDAQQSEYGRLSRHKPQVTRRTKHLPEHSSNSGKEASPQTTDIPVGYSTFNRDHSYSISSSISSYSSDVEDHRSDKDISVPNDEIDTEYSRLNLVSVTNSDSSMATNNQTLTAVNGSQPSTSYSTVKPKPKPRNI